MLLVEHKGENDIISRCQSSIYERYLLIYMFAWILIYSANSIPWINIENWIIISKAKQEYSGCLHFHKTISTIASKS